MHKPHGFINRKIAVSIITAGKTSNLISSRFENYDVVRLSQIHFTIICGNLVASTSLIQATHNSVERFKFSCRPRIIL